VVQEAIIQCISTPSADEMVKAMKMRGTAGASDGRLCEEIDDRVKAFVDCLLEGDCKRNHLTGPTLRKPHASAGIYATKQGTILTRKASFGNQFAGRRRATCTIDVGYQGVRAIRM
jgi:hypothetical protein